MGFASTAIAVGLAFVPPAGTTNIANYVVNLLAQTAAVMGAGVRSCSRAASSPAAGERGRQA